MLLPKEQGPCASHPRPAIRLGPNDPAADCDRLARFQREAQVLAVSTIQGCSSRVFPFEVDEYVTSHTGLRIWSPVRAVGQLQKPKHVPTRKAGPVAQLRFDA